MIDGTREATDVQRSRVVWTRALSKPSIGKHLRLIPLLAPALIWICKFLVVRSIVVRVRDYVRPRRVCVPSDRNLRKDSIIHKARVAPDPSAVPRVTSTASRTFQSLVVSCIHWR